MDRILAATDFSSRSDRAIRRATLLAKQFAAELVLVHVVDDDQPVSLVAAQKTGATKVLESMRRTIREVDGVGCDTRLNLGEAFQGILDASGEAETDVIVLGEHRRQVLRDIFTGTTAERVIRSGGQPVVMANAVPAGFYRNILIAVDFSKCSENAVRTVLRLGLDKHAHVTAVHVFEVPGDTIIGRSTMNGEELIDYLDRTRATAENELSTVLQDLGGGHFQCIVRHGSPAEAIRTAASELNADLVVVGTGTEPGVPDIIWGSVAQNVLRTALCDILVVPVHYEREDGLPERVRIT